MFIAICKNFFGFGANPKVDVVFLTDDKKRRPVLAESAKSSKTVNDEIKDFLWGSFDPAGLPVYSGFSSVQGVVSIAIPRGKKLDHTGIKIELLGRVGMCYILLL